MLAGWASGNLSDEQGDMVADHLDACGTCEQRLTSIESTSILADIETAVTADGFAAEPQCHSFVEAVQLNRVTTRENGHQQTVAHKRIRDYELLEQIGQGAMAAVYRARHTRLNKLVAIKVLTEKLSRDVSAVARFQREMQAVGQLNHPRIVQALDAGDADGVPFLVMELVEGLDVATLTAQRLPLEVADACEIVRQAATALEHAHVQGLIHRDIKPSNLMLTMDDGGQCRVKILDLGLATFDGPDTERHLTDEGQLMGTLEFMAPEQAEDTHTVDSRADIYSLGATLYRLLTGSVPLDGSDYNTPVKRLRALTTAAAPAIATRRDGLPDNLATLVDQMLSRDPDKRPHDMAEVASLLEEFASQHQLKQLLKGRLAEHRQEIVATNSTDWLRDTEPSLGETIASSPSERGTDRGTDRDQASTRPRSASSYRYRWRLASVLGAMLVLMSVIWLKTDGGCIRLKTSDPSIAVTIQVMKDGESYQQVRVDGDGSTVWYRSGVYEFKLPATVNDTFTVENSSFTLHRGGEEFVTISRSVDPDPPEADPVPAEPVIPHEPRTIVVTTTLVDSDAPGSLGAAIAEADDGDIIQFDPALSGSTIELRGRTIKLLDKKLKIDGSGLQQRLTLNAQARCRVLEISGQSEVTLNSLIITGGRSTSGGAGINCGPNSMTEVTQCLITGNNAFVSGRPSCGGGIQNQGRLRLQDCVISDNAATGGGGVFNSSSGDLVLEDCQILKNTSNGYGAGLNSEGNIAARDCEIAENESLTRGGGGIEFEPILVNQCTLTLERCLIRDNRSRRHGGGLRIKGKGKLVNCIVARNICSDTGGIKCFSGSALTLIHCTITENDNGGVHLSTSEETLIESSIIANNPGDKDNLTIVDAAVAGLTFRGVNLIGIAKNPSQSPAETVLRADPRLHPLGDYGGPFFTVSPQSGSPAIDAAVVSKETPSTDIRGVKRRVDGNGDGIALPDIGAFEFVPGHNHPVDTDRPLDRRETAEWVFSRGGRINLATRTISDFAGLADKELQIRGIEFFSLTGGDVLALALRVQRIPELRHLYINSSQKDPITDVSLNPLSDLHQLTSLSLSAGAVTDAGVANLKGLHRLTKLALARVAITEDGLRLIRESFPLLESLAIEARRITVKDLSSIAAMPRLEQLGLNATVEPAASLRSLSGTSATEITLRGPWQLTPDVGEVLAAMRQLKVVSFFGVTFNEQHVRQLMKAPTLQSVNFYSSKVPEKELRQLLEQHPDISIRVDGIAVTQGTRLKQ